MTYTDRFLKSYVPKKPLRAYTFSYQLEGEDTPRGETFIWHLGFRAAFSLGSRILRRRHRFQNILWIEL